MLAYHSKWLPSLPITEESLAQAMYLENNSIEQQAIAINNGICMFFKNNE
ncbi:hypothetical protein Q4489_04400 [Thalassotalea sp. 1_MG-2023]|nr:hypothetical protein [Thalassotalea sp. 1_MG-2023]MDO6426238.1 hypothetical protein [Thalassotalea sp. 1_MG-2023]